MPINVLNNQNNVYINSVKEKLQIIHNEGEINFIKS